MNNRCIPLWCLIVGGFFSTVFTTADVSFAQDGTCAEVAASLVQVDETIAKGPFQATWDSLENYQVPEWYKDAKFGIFIHWGVYSVPAFNSEWYPREMYIDAPSKKGLNSYEHHSHKWGQHSKFGYKDFIPKFRAEKFDAASWAKLFKEAGARYVVPVAEHHDGFPMYDCSFTSWNASKMGPRRDVIQELEQAVRAENMKFGVSSHRAFNWAFYPRREDFDTADPAYAGLYGRANPWLFTELANDHHNAWPPMDKQFKDDWLARTSELVDKFNPDLVWFDFGIANDRTKTYAENPFADCLQRFSAYYYNHAVERGESAIINYKWEAFPEKAAVLDLERSKMDKIRYPFWQTDTAVSSSSWGYTENQKYKTPDSLVDDLVDIVSKNGCLLLNVGPRPDGTIPVEDQQILQEIGNWLQINGEAIYETRPWKIYGEGPTRTATGHLSESKNEPFTADDIRFTAKDGALYAICLGWPDQQVTVKSLAANSTPALKNISRIKLLGSTETLRWHVSEDGLVIDLPQSQPCKYAYAFKIELAGAAAKAKLLNTVR